MLRVRGDILRLSRSPCCHDHDQYHLCTTRAVARIHCLLHLERQPVCTRYVLIWVLRSDLVVVSFAGATVGVHAPSRSPIAFIDSAGTFAHGQLYTALLCVRSSRHDSLVRYCECSTSHPTIVAPHVWRQRALGYITAFNPHNEYT